MNPRYPYTFCQHCRTCVQCSSLLHADLENKCPVANWAWRPVHFSLTGEAASTAQSQVHLTIQSAGRRSDGDTDQKETTGMRCLQRLRQEICQRLRHYLQLRGEIDWTKHAWLFMGKCTQLIHHCDCLFMLAQAMHFVLILHQILVGRLQYIIIQAHMNTICRTNLTANPTASIPPFNASVRFTTAR